jgi:hypothetical protein
MTGPGAMLGIAFPIDMSSGAVHPAATTLTDKHVGRDTGESTGPLA